MSAPALVPREVSEGVSGGRSGGGGIAPVSHRGTETQRNTEERMSFFCIPLCPSVALCLCVKQ